MTARVVHGGFTSPTLKLKITPDNWDSSVQASSGGCLIADAIKKQYPHLSSVYVDMAQIRVTDRAKGLRYQYLTPESAQTALLSFDQGWDRPDITEVKIRKAVKIMVVQARTSDAGEKRKTRIAELEAKKASGEELTSRERASLTRMKRAKKRPNGPGNTRVGSNNVINGRLGKLGPNNPNLLRGRTRLFGAKVARPAEVFEQAVEKEVEKRIAALSS